jgi:nitronate monooxygenase
MLRGRKTKHWMRSIYAVRAALRAKADQKAQGEQTYYQAGKSVAGIEGIRPAGEIVREFGEAWRTAAKTTASGE